MKAYVLAAGYATRMYPLTRDMPKGLLEVGGAPICSHIARHLRELDGLDEIVLVTNARFFGQFEAWRAAEPDGVPITLIDDGTHTDDERLGAVADLQLAMEAVPPGDDLGLVVASDNLFDFSLDGIVRECRRHDAPVLLVRRHDPGPGPSSHGEVTLDSNRRVVRFREKPADPQTDLCAIALYAMTGEALCQVGEYLATGGNCDAPGHFLAWLVERQPVYAMPLPGPWFDIGSLDALEVARERFER